MQHVKPIDKPKMLMNENTLFFIRFLHANFK
jgi:hypothetical protein